MFGLSITKNLKGIDFYKNVPSEYKQGTISGACISVVSITFLLLLSLSSIATYFTPFSATDLLID